MKAVYSFLTTVLCISLSVGIFIAGVHILVFLGWWTLAVLGFFFVWCGVHNSMYEEPSTTGGDYDDYSIL